MPSAGFEPMISATKWPQTYTLDHAAIGIGQYKYTVVFTISNRKLFFSHYVKYAAY
jgi:hypothetical protein